MLAHELVGARFGGLFSVYMMECCLVSGAIISGRGSLSVRSTLYGVRVWSILRVNDVYRVPCEQSVLKWKLLKPQALLGENLLKLCSLLGL